MVHDTVYVQLVQERVAILSVRSVKITSSNRNSNKSHLGDRRCENDDFIQLAHPLHELIDTRPLNHVNVMIVSFDLYRNGKIGLV